jgi:ribosomal protein S25
MVLFDQGTYDKLLTEAPKYKLITPSVLSDRLRVHSYLKLPRSIFSYIQSLSLRFVLYRKNKKILQLISNVIFFFVIILWYFQINGSLARRAIKDLMARGLIRLVSAHASQQIYTRATNT